VLVPLVSAAVVMFLCILPARATRAAHVTTTGYVALVQKDAAFHVVAPERGGASGRVWFDPAGPTLHFRVDAMGLHPGIQYFVELNVDGTTYEVATHAADAGGRLAFDTTLARFASGVCSGGDDAPPRPVTGSHEIKFLIKRDGNPKSGLMPRRAGRESEASVRACHGNGDGDYSYALFEGDVARFMGTH